MDYFVKHLFQFKTDFISANLQLHLIEVDNSNDFLLYPKSKNVNSYKVKLIYFYFVYVFKKIGGSKVSFFSLTK